MRTADEIRIELDEARLRVADLLRTEYESLPAEEQESYVDEIGEAEERVRRLEEELAAIG
jgi:hypothetical protein